MTLNPSRYSLFGNPTQTISPTSYSLLGHNKTFASNVSKTFAHNKSFLNNLGNIFSDIAKMTLNYNLQKWHLKQQAKLRELQLKAGLTPSPRVDTPVQYPPVQQTTPVDYTSYSPPPPDNTKKYLLFGGIALGIVGILLLARR